MRVPLIFSPATNQLIASIAVYKGPKLLGNIAVIVDSGCPFPFLLGHDDASICRVAYKGKSVKDVARGFGGGSQRLYPVEGVSIGLVNIEGETKKFALTEAYVTPPDIAEVDGIKKSFSLSLLGIRFLKMHNARLVIDPEGDSFLEFKGM